MCLYLHRLGVSQVVVLRCSLLGVLGHRAGPLLGRGQHHHLVAVAPRRVGASHGSLDVGLCDLPQIVGVRHPLVAVDAVALHGVGGLG